MYDMIEEIYVFEIANQNNNVGLFPDNYTFMHPCYLLRKK